LKEIEDIFDEIKALLARIAPGCYFLLKNLRVIYRDEYGKRPVFNERGEPMEVEVSACTNGTQLVLYRQWYEYPTIEDKIAVMLHELYHVLLRHPIRGAEFIRQIGTGDPINDNNIHFIINLCMDAKVNYLLSKIIRSERLHIPPFFDTKDLEEASVEELFYKFINNSQGCSCDDSDGLKIYINDPELAQSLSAGQDVEDFQSKLSEDKSDRSEDSNNSISNTKILNEGNSKLRSCKNPDELKEQIEKMIRDSLLAAKTAGASLTAVEARILEELLEPKVNWRTLLRQSITDGVIKNTVTTWKKLNRKLVDFPGKRIISVPNIWCFVDVSGSIGKQEFEQFMSEVTEITKYGGVVNLITWDTAVTGEYKIRRKNQIINVEFGGGGGTTFAPIIGHYRNKIGPRDMIVILTDGYWFDTDKAVELLRPFAERTVICTTEQEIPLEKAKNIKIDISS